jgi:LPS-assembly protein
MNNFFRETSSTVSLTGQGDRGYFDMRLFAFQGLANSDFQPQMATVAPIIDYNKRIALDPAKSWGIGGEIQIDANFTNSSAALASYQATNAVTLDREYGLYSVCRNAAGQPTYTQANCLLRGIGGDYASGTLQLSWQRKYIDPLGEVWTPFAFVRGNVNYLDYNNSGSASFNTATTTDVISNANQSTFLSNNNQVGGYVTPGIGMEWRYPLLSKTPIGDLVFEPIGQIIARPNGQNTNAMVNLDAQSLVFDDSNLFEWNKYSGYDRFETGVRANYGAQFTLDMKDKGSLNAMFGQSAQIAGINGYATPDAANIGIASGLDKPLSDYVSRVSYSPSSTYTFVAKARFDNETWSVRRLDATATAHFGALSGSIQYANYQSQPAIGYLERREGLQVSTRYDMTKNYFTSAFINFDLGRHYYNTSGVLAVPAPVYAIAGWGVGGGYHDDCTTFTMTYKDVISDDYGTPAVYTRNKTLLLSLELRTLGEVKSSVALSPSAVQDGIRDTSMFSSLQP